jgi:hypothetical protein
MYQRIAGVVAVLAGMLVSGAFGQTVPSEDDTFLQKHLSDVVKVESKRMDDHAIVRVFALPVYRISISIKQDNGMNPGVGPWNNNIVATRVGDDLVPVARVPRDGECTRLLSMIRPDFKLTNEDVAETLQHALDILYPLNREEDRTSETFVHDDNQWTFIRGKLFGAVSEFVVTTNQDGTIAGMKYQRISAMQ